MVPGCKRTRNGAPKNHYQPPANDATPEQLMTKKCLSELLSQFGCSKATCFVDKLRNTGAVLKSAVTGEGQFEIRIGEHKQYVVDPVRSAQIYDAMFPDVVRHQENKGLLVFFHHVWESLPLRDRKKFKSSRHFLASHLAKLVDDDKRNAISFGPDLMDHIVAPREREDQGQRQYYPFTDSKFRHNVDGQMRSFLSQRYESYLLFRILPTSTHGEKRFPITLC